MAVFTVQPNIIKLLSNPIAIHIHIRNVNDSVEYETRKKRHIECHHWLPCAEELRKKGKKRALFWVDKSVKNICIQYMISVCDFLLFDNTIYVLFELFISSLICANTNNENKRVACIFSRSLHTITRGWIENKHKCSKTKCDDDPTDLKIISITGATVVSWRVNNQEQLFVRWVKNNGDDPFIWENVHFRWSLDQK